jgi:hypothetical protein
MKIVSAIITPMPKALFDPMPEVVVILEDGTEQNLFSFYPDEITFTPQEFIGKTVQEAKQMRHQKDVSYLMD